MFGIGWAEFIFLAVAALLVLGPDKLPEAARQIGKWMRELRAVSSQLRQEFNAEFDQNDVAEDGFAQLGGDLLGDQDDATVNIAGTPVAKPKEGFGKVVRSGQKNQAP